MTSASAPEQLEALDRVKAWTRARFKLAEEDAIVALEIASGLPGCPPRETAVAFWTEGDRLHHFKVFKPAAAVTEDDLPPAWMKSALVTHGIFGCDCCS